MLYLVDFGPSYAGLATVGYAQYQTDGTVIVARTTAGVVAFGNGAYGVSVTPNALTEILKWDTGGGSPVYAHETIDMAANIVRVNSLKVNGVGSDADPWGP